jgi:2-amino-4-hydroxy-6-hydroxymethyldihydropteridine diphosphokinase
LTRFAIAIGSNLGDRVGHLRHAVEEIGRLGDRRGVSGLYETAPVGGPAQGPYLNAVVLLDSDRPPEDLLRQLQEIEARHGRQRSMRWGPRTLDLDIVSMAPGAIDSDRLVVPHPRSAERRFVLRPLCDVWPEAPVVGGIAAEALVSVTDQKVDLLARSWLNQERDPGRYWIGAQFALLFLIGLSILGFGSLPTTWAWWRVLGGVLLFAGAIGASTAAHALGTALTVMPEPVPGSELVETGPYGLVRHPIYGSLSLAAIGASLLFADRAGVALGVLLLGFFWAKSGYEERRLRMVHAGYMGYRDRVRWRLLPFLL